MAWPLRRRNTMACCISPLPHNLPSGKTPCLLRHPLRLLPPLPLHTLRQRRPRPLRTKERPSGTERCGPKGRRVLFCHWASVTAYHYPNIDPNYASDVFVAQQVDVPVASSVPLKAEMRPPNASPAPPQQQARSCVEQGGCECHGEGMSLLNGIQDKDQNVLPVWSMFGVLTY